MAASITVAVIGSGVGHTAAVATTLTAAGFAAAAAGIGHGGYLLGKAAAPWTARGPTSPAVPPAIKLVETPLDGGPTLDPVATDGGGVALQSAEFGRTPYPGLASVAPITVAVRSGVGGVGRAHRLRHRRGRRWRRRLR